MNWCILRTAPRFTMRLAMSLAEDGFVAWTPIETRRVRIPRSNVRREARLPILPGFVFAGADDLIDLIMLADMPVKPRRGAGLRLPAHSPFSVMRHAGAIPIIKDEHLSSLRRLEERRQPKRRAAYAFPRGAVVKAAIEAKGFGGMVGVVLRSGPDRTVVQFPESSVFGRVEIPTFLLAEDGANGLQPKTGSAALAA